jgi:DeoR/GlpR family transcriptional regulator of sugar metabolism
MFSAERRQLILEMVDNNGAAAVKELARAVKASEVTIRRDLRELEAAGLLSRQHGGALAADASRWFNYEQSYSEKSHVAAEEKAAIADLAAGLVLDGDAIGLGPGTTTQALARRLLWCKELTVMTNSLLVAQTMARSSGVDVVMTGGTLRGSILALVGSEAERSLTSTRIRRAFLSGNGLSFDRGLSTPNALVAGVDKALVGAAEEVVVLVDHTKVGVDTMVQTVPVSRMTHLVTDDQVPPALLDRFREAGVTVHVASPERLSESVEAT